MVQVVNSTGAEDSSSPTSWLLSLIPHTLPPQIHLNSRKQTQNMYLSHDLYQHLSRDWNAQTDVKEIPCTVSPAKTALPTQLRGFTSMDTIDASAIAVSR